MADLTRDSGVRRIFVLGILGLLLALTGGGCREQKPGVAPKTYDNLTKIGEAYMAATTTLNRGPSGIEELMPHLKDKGDIAELKRSADDGEDFVILWGVDYRSYQAQGQPLPVIAYEKTGKNGKRHVLRVRYVFHLSDDEFQQVPFPAGKQPPTKK